MTDDLPSTGIEPETAGDLREFLDRFDDPPPLGVVYTKDGDPHPRYRIVAEVEKVRPAAVPIDRATAFDLTSIEESGRLGDGIRVTIDEIQHVRAAESPVEYPPGEPQDECAICGGPFEDYGPEFVSMYANVVCTSCDERAVTGDGVDPTYGIGYHDPFDDDDDDDAPTMRTGPDACDDPVFVDGRKCWRRYRFGGYVTRKDDFDCDSVEEFERKHRSDIR